MGNVSSIIGQLKNERDRVEKQLSGLNAAPTALGCVQQRAAEPETKEDVSKESGQDCCCAKTASGQVKEI